VRASRVCVWHRPSTHTYRDTIPAGACTSQWEVWLPLWPVDIISYITFGKKHHLETIYFDFSSIDFYKYLYLNINMYACVLSVFFSCFLGYMCVVLAPTANFDLIFKILQYYLFNMFFYMTLLIINKRNYKINCARARVWVCVCVIACLV